MTPKTSKNVLLKLPNGLTAHIYRLNRAELTEVACAGRKIGRRCGWLLGERICELGEYPVVKVNVGNEYFYLIYKPLTYEETEQLETLLKTKPKETMGWLLLTFYEKTASLYNDRTSIVLLETCTTGLPPKITSLMLKSQ